MTERPRTSAKSQPGKRAPRAHPAPRPRPPEPFLRFYHPAPLRARTLAVLDRLERSADPTEHREELAAIVVELTRCGLDAYFMKPLKDAKAGFLVEQSASIGMSGAVQVISSVIRSILGRMGPSQLLSVSGSIRRFML